MSIRLNDLKNFLETSACATFSESARRLGISQPALSESIKRLEADVGSILFYRTKSGVALTPMGKNTAESAQAVFGLLAEIQPESHSMTRGSGKSHARIITIGCHPVVGSYVLPAAFRWLPRTHRIHLRHGSSRVVQAEVQKGMVDLGVVVNPVSNPDLIIRSVGKDSVCVWRSKKGGKTEPIICDPDLIQTQTILRKWKNKPSSVISSDSLELIARLTDAGAGVGIIPERTVRLLGLSLRKLPGSPTFEDEMCIVYRPEFGKTEYERAAIDAVVRAFGE